MKWLYFGLAVVATAAVLFLLNDLRLQARSATVTVNDKLPRILDKTERTAETMAALSADVRDLRELAGLPQAGGRDATLVRYADRVLDRVAATGGQVGTKPLIGKGLKDPQPAAEWVAGARKEAVWLTFRATSRHELVERLAETKFGSAWLIQLPGGDPVPLRDWIAANVPDGEPGRPGGPEMAAPR